MRSCSSLMATRSTFVMCCITAPLPVPASKERRIRNSKEVQTEKLSLKAVPLANGMVKAKTGNTTDATTYADWYKAVYVPAAESDVATQSQSAAKPAKAVKE